MEIGRAWVGWFAAHLRGVRVRSIEGDWLQAELPRIDVDVSALLGLRRVTVEGGEITARGAVEDLQKRLRSSSSETEPNSAKRSAAGPDFSVSALRLRWEGTAGTKQGAVEVQGASASRVRSESGETAEIHAESARWSAPGLRAEVQAVVGRLARPQAEGVLQWQELRAGPANIVVAVDELGLGGAGGDAEKDDAASGTAAGAAEALAVPPAPPVPDPPRNDRATAGGGRASGARSASGTRRSSKKGTAAARAQAAAAAAVAPPVAPVAAPPDPRAFARAERFRDRLMQGAVWVTEHVSPQANVELSGLNVVVAQRDERLNVGPATFRVLPRGRTVELDLRPGSSQPTASPLRVHAEVPTKAGDTVLRLEGGPVTLASLGVRENDFGLLDVGRALVEARSTLLLSADARTLSFQGDGQFTSIAILHPKLARDPVQGLDLGFRTRGTLQTDGSLLKVDEGELALGGIRLTGSGVVEHGLDFLRLDTHIDVPVSDCQRMFASIPTALVPKLIGAQMGGTFALKTSLQVDTRRPDDIEVDFQLANRCRITGVPADIRADHFRKPFQHIVYDEHDRKVPIQTGPGTSDWIPLRAISPYLEAAVMTTEDGGFRNHSGFDKSSIRNSIRDDLRAGKFVRGASTITMQVAKNLYLEREKRLSRKLQEAMLTMYLEQAFTKDEILELYFNIVEFGPMVYGVGQASEYYFHTIPFDLSLGQALFLSSILPSPKRNYFTSDGQLGKGWTNYLRRVMKIMRDRNRITDQELADGLTETLVLHAPKPLRSRPVEGDRNGTWLAPDAAP